MVEFCDECGGMMFTSRDNTKKTLKCNLCNAIKPLDDDVIKKYQYIIKTDPFKKQKIKE
jgi:DNA-directed RNA polymerase subunit M/transcription elongation factor TFIIS